MLSIIPGRVTSFQKSLNSSENIFDQVLYKLIVKSFMDQISSYETLTKKCTQRIS